MEVVAGWKWFVDLLREFGFTPAGIGLIVMTSLLLYRGWKREMDFQERQDRLHEQIDSELIRLSTALEKCERERLAALEGNLALGRWKAACEDLCPRSAEVHRVTKRGLWKQ